MISSTSGRDISLAFPFLRHDIPLPSGLSDDAVVPVPSDVLRLITLPILPKPFPIPDSSCPEERFLPNGGEEFTEAELTEDVNGGLFCTDPVDAFLQPHSLLRFGVIIPMLDPVNVESIGLGWIVDTDCSDMVTDEDDSERSAYL